MQVPHKLALQDRSPKVGLLAELRSILSDDIFTIGDCGTLWHLNRS